MRRCGRPDTQKSPPVGGQGITVSVICVWPKKSGGGGGGYRLFTGGWGWGGGGGAGALQTVLFMVVMAATKCFGTC